jgi:hypothetical protein
MNTSRRMLPLGTVALFSLFLLAYALAGASSAAAAGPATVTVRVEGLTEMKLPVMQVTTTTQPVVNDGNPEHSCSGTSALGALQVATGGNWNGSWEASFGQYLINTIEGETHLYQSGITSYYWSFWVNDTYQNEGACDVQLEPGARVLFFPVCDETCPSGPSPTPLEIEVPAKANVGESINAIVRRYNEKGEPAPAAGAHIEWRGGSAMTDAQGDATLAFYSTGAYELHVTGAEAEPAAVRTEASVCVHAGNDGTCGTALPIACPTSAGATCPPLERTSTPPPPSPLAASVRITGVKNEHTYSHRSAPRLLAGVIEIPFGGTLRQVRISLQRRYHGRCFDFSGSRENFVRTKKCGSAAFFSVGGSESFSYLLPARLPKGSYTYDIEAINSTGQATKLVSGISHVVFQVK